MVDIDFVLSPRVDKKAEKSLEISRNREIQHEYIFEMINLFIFGVALPGPAHI